MSNDNKQRVITSLLERASHPNTPEEEREACLAKADAMMIQYKIERASISWERPIEERRKPVTRFFDPSVRSMSEAEWASTRDYSTESQMAGNLGGIRRTCFSFAGARCSEKYFGRNSEKSKAQVKEHGLEEGSVYLVVVGYEEDLYYGESLWNEVFREIIRSLYPSWVSSKSLDWNVYEMKESGYSWSTICRSAIRASAGDARGLVTEKNSGSKLRTAYKREAVRRGLPAELPKVGQPQLWRESWLAGFSSALTQRMAAVKAGRKDYFEKAGVNLPALQQDEEAVDEMFEEFFPKPKPMSEEELKKLNDQIEEEAKKARSRRPAKVRTRYYDSSAYGKGHAKSQSIDIARGSRVNKAAQKEVR